MTDESAEPSAALAAPGTIRVVCEECGPQEAGVEEREDGSRVLTCPGCGRTHELPPEVSPEDQGIPASAEMPWEEVHPLFKQVVLSVLHEEVAKYEATRARVEARQATMQMAMQSVLQQYDQSFGTGGISQQLGAVMNTQLKTGEHLAEQAMLTAFRIAIKKLSEPGPDSEVS